MGDLPKELRDYAFTLDCTERPAIGELDEAALFRESAERMEKMETALRAAKDDLERLAVPEDNFKNTLDLIEKALPPQDRCP